MHTRTKAKHAPRMNRAEIRERILNRKLTIIPLTEVIAGLEDLNGHLSIRELTAAQASRIDKIAKSEDGDEDDGLSIAATFAFALVETESGLPIFEDEKVIGQLAEVLGLSVLAPVAKIIKKLSGMDEEEAEKAKKNLKKIAAKGSATSFIETSAEVLPD